jgi:hypothetical protein
MRLGASFALALLTGMLGLSGLSSKAYALESNISGTYCRNYNAAEALDIDYLTGGVRNLNANPRYVICPVVLAPSTPPYTIAVSVQGETFYGATITCTLITYDWNGSYLGSQSFPPQSGSFSQSLSTSGTLESTSSLLCALPGSAQGVLQNMIASQ